MTIDGGRVVVRLEGKDVNLGQLITKIEREMKGAQASVGQFDGTLANLTRTQKRAESEVLAYAQAMARADVASGKYAQGIQRLSAAITQITPNTVAGANAIANLQNQINKYEAQARAAEQRSKSFATNLSSSFNQLIGAAFAVQAVAGVFTELIDSGNRLEKIDATVRALSGSQEKYNEVLRIAKEQQALYGGSLEENLENLSGFIYTANTAGVAVDELANIARRLAIIDPVQGFKGASIALKEFFSGDIVSLARRFEIPKDVLRPILELGDTKEQIAALDAVLTKMGLGIELLDAQANTTAVTYDKLSGSFQDLFATVGQGVAGALEPLAAGLVTVFQYAQGGIQTLNELNTTMASFHAQVALGATGYDTYSAGVDQLNAKLREEFGLFGFLAPQVAALSEIQYGYAQSIAESVGGMDNAIARMEELRGAYGAVAIGAAQARVEEEEGAAVKDAYLASIIRLLDVMPNGQAVAFQYSAAIRENKFSAEEATAAINILINEYLANEQAALLAAEGTNQLTNEITLAIDGVGMLSRELANETVEKLNSKVASEQAALAMEMLTSLAEQAASGMITTGNAANIMAGQLGIATDEAYNLINALSQLALQREAAALGIKGMPADRAAIDNVKAYRQVYAAQQAEKAYQFSQMETNEQLAVRRRELASLSKNTEQYWKALGEVTRLEQQYAREQEKAAKGSGGSGGGSAKKNAAQKENEDRLKGEQKLRDDLIDVQADFYSESEEAEIEHYSRLAEIYEDYAKAQRKAEQENEISKRRNKADFYAGLDPSENEGIDVGKFSAQYEAAFAEAQRIAQEGKAQLSQEFLELRQQQIEEMMELEKQIASVQADDNLSDKDKKARIEYLEGLKKLYEDAQAEELKALVEAGDANVNALNDRLTEEEKRYAEQTTKISEEARKQADEKVIQAERSRQAVLKENEALAAQYKLLQDITATGAKPTGLPAGLPALPATQTSTAPIPVSNVDGAEANSLESAMFVKQVEVWRSYDEVVNGTLNVVGARLEQRLSDIITAVDTSRDSIIRSLAAVERAVGKISTQSVVSR